MKFDLAIVIPAFKGRYLIEALDSIANQTCKNFTLYIGDDCSPDELYSIIKKYEESIDIIYRRFEENLGSVSLVKQWERCISMTREESWIWLFSDDDIAPPDAVERFYNTIKATNEKYPVYRFDLLTIDAFGQERFPYTPKKRIESSKEFLEERMKFEYMSAACEYIFKREIYVRNDGFIEYPMGWYSDDATWALFAKDSFIYTIEGLPVKWRKSLNISSDEKNKIFFYNGFLNYYVWLNKFLCVYSNKSELFNLSVFYAFKMTRSLKEKLSSPMIRDVFLMFQRCYGTKIAFIGLLKYLRCWIRYA